MMIPPPVSPAEAEADTRRWLERAVIGLNLCPFAKAVHAKGQVHYALYLPFEDAGIMDALLHEARQLLVRPSTHRETTLLIAPHTLHEFLVFNDVVARADRMLAQEGFEGQLQLASFHPYYQFAGTDPDDITNATNRAPYPTFHLLREESVGRAVDAYPDTESIVDRNMSTLTLLGPEGWKALDVGPGSTP
jgi:hypothetical protein